MTAARSCSPRSLQAALIHCTGKNQQQKGKEHFSEEVEVGDYKKLLHSKGSQMLAQEVTECPPLERFQRGRGVLRTMG